MSRKIRERLKREQGQALVEFALVFPVFLVIVLFIVDACWVGAQRTAFEHGFIYSSWTITPEEIGYNSNSATTTINSNVDRALLQNIAASNLWGLRTENVRVSNARASFYNSEETFNIPAGALSDYDSLEGKSVTLHMDLKANIEYSIFPLTFVGKWFFGDPVVLEKQYETNKVLNSQTRTG